MNKKNIILYLLILTFLIGCDDESVTDLSETESTYANVVSEDKPKSSDFESNNKGTREVIETINYIPSASGVDVFTSESIIIDYSNGNSGYIMVNYTGSNTAKIKFQLTGADGRTYTYNLKKEEGYQVFPLTGGSGSYTMNSFEQTEGDKYFPIDTRTATFQIEDELSCYLYPNQFVNYSDTTLAIVESRELAQNVSSDLELIERVYDYVMDTISYDDDLAESALSGSIAGYIPDLDHAINTGQGICFDYAALMTAMLRSQEIPTKLVLGYSGEIYHAWISVYTDENGWIDDIIEFDGKQWKLMDPTFADTGGQSKSVQEYIGEGTNYSEKYVY